MGVTQYRKKNWQLPKYRVENRQNTDTAFMIGHAFFKVAFIWATYDFCLAMADMDKLEQTRTLQSLILFFKCFKLDGPNYISKFFTLG